MKKSTLAVLMLLSPSSAYSDLFELECTFLRSARFGNYENLHRVIDRIPNKNVEDEHNMSALMWAAKKGYEQIAQLLLNSGATINYGNKKPIHIAAERNDLRLIILFLNNRANPLDIPTELRHKIADKLPEPYKARINSSTALTRENPRTRIRVHIPRVTPRIISDSEAKITREIENAKQILYLKGFSLEEIEKIIDTNIKPIISQPSFSDMSSSSLRKFINTIINRIIVTRNLGLNQPEESESESKMEIIKTTSSNNTINLVEKEPYTQCSFKQLIQESAEEGKSYYLAEVITKNENGATFTHFFDAESVQEHMNDVNFKNTLNNLPVAKINIHKITSLEDSFENVEDVSRATNVKLYTKLFVKTKMRLKTLEYWLKDYSERKEKDIPLEKPLAEIQENTRKLMQLCNILSEQNIIKDYQQISTFHIRCLNLLSNKDLKSSLDNVEVFKTVYDYVKAHML